MREEKEMLESVINTVKQIVKIVGSIIADLALLNFKVVFWTIRIILIGSVSYAVFRGASNFSAMSALGLVLICLGFVFIARTHKLVEKYPISSGCLIIGDTFAVVRHPMYSGMSLIMIGCSIVSHCWLITVLTLIIIVLMLSFSNAEEEENYEILGEQYRDYCSHVPFTGIVFGLIRILIIKLKNSIS